MSLLDALIEAFTGRGARRQAAEPGSARPPEVDACGRPCHRYARPGPRAGGLDPDQAALRAVQARGLPCRITATADAEGLGTGRVRNASLVVGHALDLIPRVEAGTLTLGHAAAITRIRLRAPDLAARIEPRLTGDTWEDSHILRRAWARAAADLAAAGNKRWAGTLTAAHGARLTRNANPRRIRRPI